MKKLFLALIMSFTSYMMIGQDYQVSIVGTVLSIENGGPVEDYLVSMYTDSIDGNFWYFNTVITDDNGNFSDMFDVPIGNEGTLYVSVLGCQGQWITEEVDFSENNTQFSFVFEVCNVPLGDDCEAMFYTTVEPNNYLAVQFYDISMGQPNTWDWDFGDGGASSDQNPLHTYAQEGAYDVTLTISSDSMGCTSTVILPVYVTDSIIFPDSCMAWFYSYPDQNDFLTINFVDQSISDGNNPPDSWSWSFGDGATSEEQNPVHTYTEEGEYEVCLSITNADGSCENTFCEWLFVSDWNEECMALFYAYPIPDSVPSGSDLAMQFMDYSYGNPDTWMWEFGDGTTSSEQNPIHLYSDEGIYDVCLTIENIDDSCFSTLCQVVEVGDTTTNCMGWFTYEMNDLTVDFMGYLENSQQGNYEWDFGDGTTGTGSMVSHTYSEDGIYMVTMIVYDSVHDCFGTYTDMLWVGDVMFDISGYVYLADSMMADAATVYLMTFDSIGNEVISIDETAIDENGYYEFNEIDGDDFLYFVQAALTEESDYYDDYVPTYHWSAMYWYEAMPVFPFPMGYPVDVYMIETVNSNAGEGAINGFVANQESRFEMSNVEVLLLNEAGEAYSFRMTDEAGDFSFPELAFGTYVVYTEIMGIETIPVTVILDEDNPVANVDIIVNNGQAVLGIKDFRSVYVEEIGDIYPNPVLTGASIDVVVTQQSDVQLSISNNFGQTIYLVQEKVTSGTQRFDLYTEQLPKGLYFVSIKTQDGLVMVKKLVKL